MKNVLSFLLFSVISIIHAYAQNSPVTAVTGEPAERFMAITIDDLPVNSIVGGLAHREYITDNILQALKKHNAPDVGFVNEIKLYQSS